ncbi:MAG: hypothetical protein ACYCTI_01610 [Acidimicrobiales bacterium]
MSFLAGVSAGGHGDETNVVDGAGHGGSWGVAMLVYLSEPGPGRVVPIALAGLAALAAPGAGALVDRSRRSPRPGIEA